MRSVRVVACVLVCLLSCVVAREAAAKCSPHRTMKIVIRVDDPSLPAEAFARQPKTIYRLGEKYGRVDEEKNPETGLHLLIVVNEPDVWIVNRADATGQHSVDPGPDLSFRAPITGDPDSKYWNNFEFGCEVPFMQAATPVVRTVDDAGTTTYEHTAEGITATLVVSKSGIPQRVTIATGGDRFSFVYDAYEQLDSADTSWFEKPAGITYTELEPPAQP